MEVKEVLKVRHYKAGYEVREELLEHAEDQIILKSAYTPEGNYIGRSKDAYYLCKKRGIKPELADEGDNVCTIGFSSKEKKYFGWSHRAIHGFGIDDSVKKGDCAYQPTDERDFLEDCLRFWDEEYHTNMRGEEIVNEEGVLGIKVSWTYDDKVPNKRLWKTISGVFAPYPKKWGKGEWTAMTLEDTREMAIAFAESVG